MIRSQKQKDVKKYFLADQGKIYSLTNCTQTQQGSVHRELCKKFKYGYTNKYYFHNPETMLENDTQHY